jgi:hypothetical protein
MSWNIREYIDSFNLGIDVQILAIIVVVLYILVILFATILCTESCEDYSLAFIMAMVIVPGSITILFPAAACAGGMI